MKRLDVLELFELAETLSGSGKELAVEKAKPLDVFFALTSAETSLKKFRDNQPAFSLTRESASATVDVIDMSLRINFYADDKREKFKDGLNFEQEIDTWSFYQVKTALQGFRHVFATECRKSETYFIEQKMGFDITSLLHTADDNLHESIRPFVGGPAAVELKAAGRCFALENYTACGFHTLRALEVVMGDYYKQISGKDKEFRSWFDYIEAFQKLEKSKSKRGSKYPSLKVSAMLDRMRQLDRNPLMHPRDSLDEMGADSLFKLGIVTITELAKDIRDMAAMPELKLVTDNAKGGQAG